MDTDPATHPSPQTSTYGLVFEASPDAIILHQEGSIVEVNPAAARLLRRARQQLPGMPLLHCIPAADRDRVAQHLKDPEAQQIQTHILRPDGSMVPVTAYGASTESMGVSIMRMQSDGVQVMERDAQLSRLEQMNQFKTQLLNTAAHELNTPLTPLRLQIHLLRSQNLGRLSGRQSKAIDVLDRNVERLSLLVNDILDVARLESGHLAIELDDVNLNDLIHETAESYEETARGIGVELLVEDHQDVTVRADPRRMLQVIYNLVSNGIKFTPAGGRVTIRTGAKGHEGYVEVEDTGLGMDPDQLTRLFEPFSRVHDTETTAIPGTGLGLYISRGIMQQHNGTLTAHSDGLGKGTKFRATMPLAAHPVRTSNRPARHRSSLIAGPLAQRLRELI